MNDFFAAVVVSHGKCGETVWDHITHDLSYIYWMKVKHSLFSSPTANEHIDSNIYEDFE